MQLDSLKMMNLEETKEDKLKCPKCKDMQTRKRFH